MHVSEIFHSIQGEGALAGMPSTFIRLAHCNLSCSWCDAAYTWKGNVDYRDWTIPDIGGAVMHRHVVLTGGEPTFADDFDALTFALGHRHLTVETNGTIFREPAVEHVDLWSVSPKLGSSKQGPMLNEAVLLLYTQLGPGRVQWKFVIDDEDDFQRALLLMRRLHLGREWDGRVFMQPNGLCHIFQADEIASSGRLMSDGSVLGGNNVLERQIDGLRIDAPYLTRLRWLYERVVDADQSGDLPCAIRAVPQSHKLAWGNRRGF